MKDTIDKVVIYVPGGRKEFRVGCTAEVGYVQKVTEIKVINRAVFVYLDDGCVCNFCSMPFVSTKKQ